MSRCGMWFNVHSPFQPQGYVHSQTLWNRRPSYHDSQVICARTTMRNPSNASGQGVAKVSHDNTTASATNSYTRIIGHLHARVAGSRLHGLMPLTVIVRYVSLTCS